MGWCMRAHVRENFELNHDEDTPHAHLAYLMVKTETPVGFLAQVCQVSRPTAYRWLRGGTAPKDEAHQRKLQKLSAVLTTALRERSLPLVRFSAAEHASIVGRIASRAAV